MGERAYMYTWENKWKQLEKMIKVSGRYKMTTEEPRITMSAQMILIM